MYNKLVTGRPGIQVTYVNSQRFLQKYIESMVSKRSDDFLEFCKNTDVLILDDFHSFKGINEQVMEYLASKIGSDVRSLEGALVSLIGNSYALKKDIDILLAESVLKKILKSCRKK